MHKVTLFDSRVISHKKENLFKKGYLLKFSWYLSLFTIFVLSHVAVG